MEDQLANALPTHALLARTGRVTVYCESASGPNRFSFTLQPWAPPVPVPVPVLVPVPVPVPVN